MKLKTKQESASERTVPFKLVAVSLFFFVACGLMLGTANAMKGKVPIYMPIPIPIPMPIGHPGMGRGQSHAQQPHYHNNHHHHHQQGGDHGHQDNGAGEEGEVKKIYLLQPVPKMIPQPNLKGGGFMGPVQTHIHLNNLQRKTSYVPSMGAGHPHTMHADGIQSAGYLESLDSRTLPARSGTKATASDLKILPIVVIPPIAPLRMHTSSVDADGYSAGRSSLSVHHDARTFADYGRSLGRGDRWDDRSAGRFRGRSSWDQRGDEAGDDYELGSSWRASQHGRGSRRDGSKRRANYEQAASSTGKRASRTRVGSIRDVIDKHSSFEDELDDMFGESRDIALTDQRAGYRRATGYESGLDKYSNSPARHPGSNDKLDLIRRDSVAVLQGGRLHASSSGDIDRDRDYPERDHRFDESAKLAPLYYERDVQEPRLAPSRQAASRLHQDHRYPTSLNSRDTLEDDEWRFDSIKSVTHVGLNETAPVATQANATMSA